MITPDGKPKTIEFNARFGDPETQVVLPRLKTDLLDVFLAAVNGNLADLELEWSDEAAVCVILASGGYPASYPKGIAIHGLDNEQDGRLYFMREPPAMLMERGERMGTCPGRCRIRG